MLSNRRRGLDTHSAQLMVCFECGIAELDRGLERMDLYSCERTGFLGPSLAPMRLGFSFSAVDSKLVDAVFFLLGRATALSGLQRCSHVFIPSKRREPD